MGKKPTKRFDPGSQKVPRIDSANQILAGKNPRAAVAPQNFDKERPSWGLQTIEKDGPFGWSKIPHKELWDNIIKKLGEFETMTWAEIKGPNNHFISIDKCDKKAQKRLKDIDQDDVDQLFSLRLMGKYRVFGIMEGAKLKILWCDPDHLVCPSKLKHT